MLNWNNIISFILCAAAGITIIILQHRGDIGMAWIVAIISTSAIVMTIICKGMYQH